MEANQSDPSRAIRVYVISGSVVFISALVYYLTYRTQLPWPGYLFNPEYLPQTRSGDITQGTYPSFAFTLSIGLFCLAMFKQGRQRAATAVFGVWVVGLVHEITLGTFSPLDLVAGSTGALIVLAILFLARRSIDSETNRVQLSELNRHAFRDRCKFTALMIVSATLATGTSSYEPRDSRECITYDENGICIERRITASPVYLSYAALRSAVKMSGPRELNSVSRVYLYKSMLFVNERNEGIHIIDNRFPASPERIGFIEIPGNTEISIRDDYLYADSYIDLVTLDLSNIENITEIAREQDIFPYNSRQNIPDNVNLTGTIDSTRGVITGYQ